MRMLTRASRFASTLSFTRGTILRLRLAGDSVHSPASISFAPSQGAFFSGVPCAESQTKNPERFLFEGPAVYFKG